VEVYERFPVGLRRILGHAEYHGLSLVGRLSDRFEFVYRMDALMSSYRRVRIAVRSSAAERLVGSTLRRSEISRFSQNGEDGVIDEIFARIGTTNRHAIEIGASDGMENCTRSLVEAGWTAHWIEGNAEQAKKAAETGGARVTVIGEYTDRHTVVRQLSDAGASSEPDLLVVDIDGDDLGILAACLDAFRPRVVVVEYNAAFSCAAVWAMKPTAPGGGWDGTFRHGATLGALHHLAAQGGYQLVYCESAGVNAFFVRGDQVGEHFAMAGDIAAHFQAASHSAHPFGHPRSRRSVAPMTPLTVADVAAINVTGLRLAATRLAETLSVVVEIENGSDRWLTSPQQPHAFQLALRWVTESTELPFDLRRIPLPRPLAPHSRCRIHLLVSAVGQSTGSTLRATVVGEGVAWREHLGGTGAFLDAHVSHRDLESQTSTRRR
jgi:hypothetical protein